MFDFKFIGNFENLLNYGFLKTFDMTIESDCYVFITEDCMFFDMLIWPDGYFEFEELYGEALIAFYRLVKDGLLELIEG